MRITCISHERVDAVMNVKLSRLGWTTALSALLLGVLTTLALCADPAPVTPSYLDTAKYLGAAKCKMCHNKPAAPTYTQWDTTRHAALSRKSPWDKDGEKVAVPAVEVAYRYMTGYDATTKTWMDKGVTCEACHGPGGAHMMGKDKKATIMDPEDLKTPGQQISVCGRCHGQYAIGPDKVALKYKAGQDLLTTEGFKLDAVQPHKPMQEMNELVTSDHFKDKGMTCITCHVSHSATPQPHSLKKPVNALCGECHKEKTMAAHAPKAAADATCATCHMPKGSHAFGEPAH
jgi:predicted CXXCH cytochrome family protein